MNRTILASITRWPARVSGILLWLLVLTFYFGEGPFNPLQQPPGVQVQLFFELICLAGMLILWKWELQGALLSLAGILLFYFGNYLQSGHWPGGAFPLFFLPGILALITQLIDRRDRK